MKYIIILITLFSANILMGQQLISEYSWLLTVSPDSRYIVYLKADIEEMDEYVEGNIYIYDVNKKSHSLINEVSYMLNFIQVKWVNDDYFFISNGSVLEYYAFVKDEKKCVYQADEEALINYFDVSSDGENVALNIEENKKIKEQKILLLSLKAEKLETILKLKDESIGEDLRNHLTFSPNNKFIVIDDIANNLLVYNIEKKNIESIDKNVLNVMYATDNEIFYTKENALIEYGIYSGEKLSIFEGENIKVSFAGEYNGDIAVCLNDNVMLYNEKGIIKKLKSLRKGKYIYIKNGIAIEELDNAIYLSQVN